MLQVEQVDRKLNFFRKLPDEQKAPPRVGWIRTIRKAMGMSGEVLAARLGVSQSAEVQFEKGERDQSISLQTLKKIANALEADFVYAIVPRRPIRKILEERAMEKAQERIRPLVHSMHLESQGTNSTSVEIEVKELARQLLERPKELWR
jgi:predicted DNA-binding mobile mystery protein A